MTEKTTIQVTKDAADELKRRFPHLRNDAVRVSVLLGIVKIEELPRPADGESIPVITIAES
jgi:hypothetical protein